MEHVIQKHGKTFTVTGAKQWHEVFRHPTGSWNISLLRDAIAARPSIFGSTSIPLSDRLIAEAKAVLGNNPASLLKIPPMAIEEPLIGVASPIENKLLIIDGYHRILKAVEFGFSKLPAYTVLWSFANKYSVTYTEQKRTRKFIT